VAPEDRSGEPDVESLLRRGRQAIDAGEWRMAHRFAQAATALGPDRLDAQRLLRETDEGLAQESVAAIQAAAQLREHQEQGDGARRRRLPSFTTQSLRRANFGNAATTTEEARPRRRRRLGVGLPVVRSGVWSAAAAVVLFFLFASVAFGAFQLMGGGDDDGTGDTLVASTPGAGGAAGPPPTETPTAEATAEPTATPEPGVAPASPSAWPVDC
jgi:hypothetical protein